MTMRVTNRTIVFYAEHLASMGCDLESIAEHAGLLPRCLASRSERVSMEQVFAFIREALKQTGNPALGLELGARITLSDLGMLGYAMESADNLAASLRLLTRYHRITGDIYSPRLVESADEAKALAIDFHVSPEELEPFFTDELLAGLPPVAQGLIGEEALFQEVHLRHARPSYAADYSAYLGCPVFFSADSTRLVLRSEVLERPCRLRDEETAAECELICQKLEQRLAAEDTSLIGSIQKLLQASPGSPPTRDEVASVLNVSTRTLTRRLARLDTSYREIVDTFHCDLAKSHLLSCDSSLEAISELMGFSDKSAFIRAFRRWTGMSPGAYRVSVRSSLH